MAPVTLLLRRARSVEYLNPPERVELPGQVLRHAEIVIAARNSVLHGLGPAADTPVNDAFRSILQLLQHICVLHPAFPRDGHGVMLALIRDEIFALDRVLARTG